AIREEPIDFLDRSFSSSSWPFYHCLVLLKI
ncbi:hypothetical protein BOV42_004192, partial [Escherichia coli]